MTSDTKEEASRNVSSPSRSDIPLLLPPHETAVLYKSFKDRERPCCGHAVIVPLNRFVARLLLEGRGVAVCPSCDMPVAYIEDGEVAAKKGCGDVPSVYFKYGKMVYRLSVGKPQADQQKDGDEKPYWWMFWTSNNDSKNVVEQTITAQQRIMSVLGISHGMKVRTVS
jgi:hypothetical protein